MNTASNCLEDTVQAIGCFLSVDPMTPESIGDIPCFLMLDCASRPWLKLRLLLAQTRSPMCLTFVKVQLYTGDKVEV